jgi:hypothetical protein
VTYEPLNRRSAAEGRRLRSCIIVDAGRWRRSAPGARAQDGDSAFGSRPGVRADYIPQSSARHSYDVDMTTFHGVAAPTETDLDSPEPQRYVAQILPSFAEIAADGTLLGRITEFNKFSFTVFYSNNGALTRPSVAEDVLVAVLRNLNDILVTSGIHYLQSVEAESQRPATKDARLDGSKAVVAISLPHSVYHFALRIFDDRFVITRESSSLADFYSWYRLFMPSAAQLEATARQAVARVYGHPLEVTQTQFEFKFIFSDFTKDVWRERRDPRNVDVLSALIPNVANRSGPTELSKQDFTRLDLTFSRLERFAAGPTSKWRNCWYMLEAPSNERRRFIVFTAQLRNVASELVGESAGGDEMSVIAFDPDFADDHYLAMAEFLNKRALDDFMGRVLENWKFDTQRQL